MAVGAFLFDTLVSTLLFLFHDALFHWLFDALYFQLHDDLFRASLSLLVSDDFR
jgi:hypothetical protein